MKVMVITEDYRLDQHILKPILRKLFADLGRGNVTIDFCREPHIGGLAQATDRRILMEVFEIYPQADLFLLIVDRDCESGREDAMNGCLVHAGDMEKAMLGCIAREEIEIWALALHHDQLGERWSTVRQHCHPKETYFEPFVRERNWEVSVGKGRKDAMKNLPTNWSGLKTRCDELRLLQEKIRVWLEHA